VSSLLKKPFDPKDGLVVQYEATLQDGLECGGAYLKFLNTDEKAFTPDTLDGDSPYTLMFGPDRCGGTDKVHVIVRHAAPSGAVEEKHLASPPRMPNDKFPHLYGLAITAAGDVTVKIDGEAVFEGSLFDQGVFEPPFNPPAEIDDEADEKPDTWIDDPQMDDPDATKPEDWDENAPSSIPDEDAEKPEGWLDDEPLEVEDPSASQPSDWDEDEDGSWEAPIVANPKCAEAPGCGNWERPTKYNPDYKGKWYAPRIYNPEYKGEWSPRKIPNPDHYLDEMPLKSIGKIGAVALEVWTMSSGLVVDNVLVAQNDVAAKELEDVWRPKFDAVKAVVDADEKAKFDTDAAPVEPGFVARMTDTISSGLFAVANVLPEGPVRNGAVGFVTTLSESSVSLFAFVALILLVILLLLSSLFGSDSEEPEKEAKKAVGKKKKTDAPEPDDEAEEEEEEEEEEDSPVKSPIRRKTTRKA